MTEIKDLQEIAQDEDIEIMQADCPESGSVSLLFNGKCYIGIDEKTPEICKKERTAHELGHCIKGAFYNIYSPYDVISRHEARADRWAIEELIPNNELVEQLKQNVDSIYALAQYFEVSEDFMKKACRYYGCYNG